MSDTKKCPYCGEEIPVKATRCKFCKEWLTDADIPQLTSNPESHSIEIDQASILPQESTKPKNKSLWVIVGVSAVAVIGIVIALLSLNNKSKSRDSLAPSEVFEEIIPEIPVVPPAPEEEPGDQSIIIIQEDAEDDGYADAVPYMTVMHKPTFNGKDPHAFSAWVSSNAIDPTSLEDSEINGRVIVRFIIDVDGSVSNVEVLRGINSSIDSSIKELVQSSPKWTPGRDIDDNLVKVSITEPIIIGR